MKTKSRIELTTEKRRALEDLWFIYGNGGSKHSQEGHKFIQHILEHGEDIRLFYRPGREVIAAVDRALGASHL